MVGGTGLCGRTAAPGTALNPGDQTRRRAHMSEHHLMGERERKKRERERKK